MNEYAPDTKQFLETRSEVKVNVTGTQGWSSQDAYTYQIWDFYLK